jgi:hypothetical protein
MIILAFILEIEHIKSTEIDKIVPQIDDISATSTDIEPYLAINSTNRR